jgi:hypothetical protein
VFPWGRNVDHGPKIYLDVVGLAVSLRRLGCVHEEGGCL